MAGRCRQGKPGKTSHRVGRGFALGLSCLMRATHIPPCCSRFNCKAGEMALVAVNNQPNNELIATNGNHVALQQGPARTSNLLSPIMLLTGHGSEIFSVKFHPDGQYLASAGFDRQIFFWNTYGECENFAVLSGHTGAVMDLQFSTDGDIVYTCSTDKTVCLWDTKTGTKMKKLKGHSDHVNAVHSARRGPQLICTGSDDCTVKIWDPRRRSDTITLDNLYQILAVTFNDTAEQVICAGIDNDVKVWDLRNQAILHTMKGHSDTVTGLALSPDGSYVLSNSMDNSLRVWDIRPYAPQERCVKMFSGHTHSFEKNLLRCSWSSDGNRVSAGSADRFVYVWDTTSRRIIYKLPGHNGSVNDVAFHPKEPVVASAGSDRQIYLGELEP